MVPYRIRPAVRADCRGIAEVQVDSYRATYAGLFPRAYLARFTYDEQEQDWIELLAASPDDILLVATVGEQVAGYILARAGVNSQLRFDAEIIAIHVRRPAQGQGIGRALLRHASAALQSRGCRSVMLWTLAGNPNRRWYERLQGKLVGEKCFEVEGWDIVEVAYGWDDIAALS